MKSKELRQARERLEMTRAQMAAYLGVDVSSISRWETAQRAIPGPVCKLIEMALSGLAR